MGLFNPRSRGERAHCIYHENARFQEILREKKKIGGSVEPPILVRVFITDLILRHSAEVVETYSQSAENACVYKEFCNTKGI